MSSARSQPGLEALAGIVIILGLFMIIYRVIILPALGNNLTDKSA
jgi:hypothetical protein